MYLDTFARNGIILNPKKFQFCKRKVEFAGLTLIQTGIKPSQKLLDSIIKFPIPQCISDARAWFGLVEQGSWAFSRAEVMGPFSHLLRPRNLFVWTDQLDIAFRQSKQEIVRQISLGVQHFDPNLPTCIATDYSGIGIGFSLLQKHCNCADITPTRCKQGWHVVLVGFRFLTLKLGIAP